MKQKRRMPPFYALNDDLPLLLAISSGLQHALAMLAGLITPPILLASALNLDAATSSYMISASLIGCGAYVSAAFFFSGVQAFLTILLVDRYPESDANVPSPSLRSILSRNWVNHGGWNKFCNSLHGQRG